MKSNKGTRQSRCLSLSRPISYCISSHFAIYRGETLGLAKEGLSILLAFFRGGNKSLASEKCIQSTPFIADTGGTSR